MDEEVRGRGASGQSVTRATSSGGGGACAVQEKLGIILR